MSITEIDVYAKIFLGFTTLAATIVIARAQLKISKTQAEISRTQVGFAEQKLRFDLYEKRYEVFDSFMNITHHVVQNATVQSYSDIQPDLLIIRKNKWLFSNEIQTRADEFWRNINLLMAEDRKHGRGQSDANTAEKMHELQIWFYAQYEQLDHLFEPYLRITQLGETDRKRNQESVEFVFDKNSLGKPIP